MDFTDNVRCSSDLVDSSTIAIVLAGGTSSRVGSVGRILPKCMLPISSSETIITRLLCQLTSAGLCQIVVSASELHYDLFKAFLGGYAKESKNVAAGVDATIRLFKNAEHSGGPCNAFANILNKFQAKRYLLCLSDIVFIENPFLSREPIKLDGDVILYSRHHDPRQGGVIISNRGTVSGLSYEPVDQTFEEGVKLLNWTGSALIRGSAVDAAANAGVALENRPLEALLSRLVQDRHSVRTIDAGSFFNINSMEDYQRLIVGGVCYK